MAKNWCLNLSKQDTFYKERSGGQWVWWTYDDGVRVSLNAKWAQQQVDRGTARLVVVK